VRESERLHNQFILVHSTLSYIQSPEQPLGIPLVINHRLHTLNHHKEVILTTQEHSPSLLSTQPQSEHPLTLQVNKLYKYRKKTITRIKKEQITPGISGIIEFLRPVLEPMHMHSL